MIKDLYLDFCCLNPWDKSSWMCKWLDYMKVVLHFAWSWPGWKAKHCGTWSIKTSISHLKDTKKSNSTAVINSLQETWYLENHEMKKNPKAIYLKGFIWVSSPVGYRNFSPHSHVRYHKKLVWHVVFLQFAFQISCVSRCLCFSAFSYGRVPTQPIDQASRRWHPLPVAHVNAPHRCICTSNHRRSPLEGAYFTPGAPC